MLHMHTNLEMQEYDFHLYSRISLRKSKYKLLVSHLQNYKPAKILPGSLYFYCNVA